MMKDMAKLITDILEQIFQGGALNDISKILKLDFVAYWANTEATKIMDNIFITIGILMVLIYFTSDIIDKIQLQQASYEYYFKTTIKMFIGICLISNCVQIYGDLNYACINLTKQVEGVMQINSGSNVFDIQPKIDEINKLASNELGFNVIEVVADFAVLMGYTVWSFLLMIIYAGIQLLVYWICFSRLLKMFIYATFAPIGMSDIMSGMNSRGMKYLKTYLALCFQGVVILVTAFASSFVTRMVYDVLYNLKEGSKIAVDFTPKLLLAYALSQLIVAMAISRSEQISKEVIGV